MKMQQAHAPADRWGRLDVAADRTGSSEGAFPIRILIADDHVLFAEAITVALEDLGMSVVGIVSSIRETIASLERSMPDLILMDIGLPDGSGLAAGRAILERWPAARIIALTALEDRSAFDEALQLGFRGYVSKDTSVSKFVNWIRMVVDGHLVFPQRLPSVRSGVGRGARPNCSRAISPGGRGKCSRSWCREPTVPRWLHGWASVETRCARTCRTS